MMTVEKLLSSYIMSKCFFVNYFITCILLIIVSDVKQYGTDGHIINNNDEIENYKILNNKNNNFNQIQHHQDSNYSITATFSNNSSSGSSIRGSRSSSNNNNNNNFNYDNNYYNGNTNNNIRRRLMDINGSDFNWIDYLDYNSDLKAVLKTEEDAISHFISFGKSEGRRYNKKMPGMENFDWRAYLELNQDLPNGGVTSEKVANDHYYAFGRLEGRFNSRITPHIDSFNEAREKLMKYLNNINVNQISPSKTNLIIYHIEDVEFSSNSLDVTMNNVKLFGTAVNEDNYNRKDEQKAFYWLNVVGVSENPLIYNFPLDQSNIAILKWENGAEDMNSHLETLLLLGYDLCSQFSTLFFSSTGVRGPFHSRENNQWIDDYRQLLDYGKVGIVGATISCTGRPHVQTHFFCIRSALVKDILLHLNDTYLPMKQWVKLLTYFEHEISAIVERAGYDMASMLHYKHLNNQTVFTIETGCANNSEARGKLKLDTNKWCIAHIDEVNFLRWSGESLGAPRFLCSKAVAMNEESVIEMRDAMAGIMAESLKNSKIPQLDSDESSRSGANGGGLLKALPFTSSISSSISSWLTGSSSTPQQLTAPISSMKKTIQQKERSISYVISEAISGGTLHDLYKSFSEEMWLDKTTNPAIAKNAIQQSHRGHVCFLVGTYKSHDSSQESASKYSSLRTDVEVMIKSLYRQSSPYWKVYFYPLDRMSFSTRLREVVDNLKDSKRFSFIEVLDRPPNYRLKTTNGFKIVTNLALKVVQLDPDCTWVSITNADNAYGSTVVEKVLSSRVSRVVSNDGSWDLKRNKLNDIILAPLDSKDYAHQDYIQRQHRRWDQRCTDVEAMLHHNLLAYTTQPIPHPGRVDLAAMFLFRDKLVSDGIDLGNDSNPLVNLYSRANLPTCYALKCEDGYFAHYLVKKKRWSYKRLPVDGLKSIVFHGPSPTLCIASGSVWFDYPLPYQVGCLSHRTVETLKERDNSGRAKFPAFDWNSFYQGGRLCLRLSEVGHTFQLKNSKKHAITGKEFNLIPKKIIKSKMSNRRYLLVDEDDEDADGHLDHDYDHHLHSDYDHDEEYIGRSSSDDEKALAISTHFHTMIIDDHNNIDSNIIIINNNNNNNNISSRRQLNADAATETALSSTTLELPMGFDWRAYLQLNPDLIQAGLITKKLAVEHYLTIGYKENRQFTEEIPSNLFFWKAYLEFNHDVPSTQQNKLGAIQHYKTIGSIEHRPALELKPIHPSWELAKQKLDDYVNILNFMDVPIKKRVLLIYHIDSMADNLDSSDVFYNNLYLFLSSIPPRPSKDSNSYYIFYLFTSVASSSSSNNNNKNNVDTETPPSYLPDLPISNSNVAHAVWTHNAAVLYLQFQTIRYIQRHNFMTNNFFSVIATSTMARGPVSNYHNEQWVASFCDVLSKNNVALVGPTLSCSEAPHVQTYFFAVRIEILPLIVYAMNSYKEISQWKSFTDYFEIELSALVQKGGYRIASLATNAKLNESYFASTCQQFSTYALPTDYKGDYNSWCVMTPQDVVFMHWGGESIELQDGSVDRYLCGKPLSMANSRAVAEMETLLLDLQRGDKNQQTISSSGGRTSSSSSGWGSDTNNWISRLIVPESISGGYMYDVSKQYAQELWHDRLSKSMIVQSPPTVSIDRSNKSSLHTSADRVCFLVRTAKVHDTRSHNRNKFDFDDMGIADFIESLLRQTNVHWKAFFFITDQVPFETRLQEIIKTYQDSRLEYFHLDYRDRPAFTKSDAGYTSTDRVISVLRDSGECTWLTVTNADNVYGSDIVNNVLTKSIGKDGVKPVDMLLAPLDSRNFAETDYRKRNEDSMNHRCLGILAMFRHSLLSFTVQPIPVLGRVDLAAVFFHRKKFEEEDMYFGNFTHPTKYPCIGCQDGYLTQHLVRSKRWTYIRLPIDGLKSIIFHGPSPTLCIASGNVWFDYPQVNKVGCFNHQVVHELQVLDNPVSPRFDWDYFISSGRKCLRISKQGSFNRVTGQIDT